MTCGVLDGEESERKKKDGSLTQEGLGYYVLDYRSLTTRD